MDDELARDQKFGILGKRTTRKRRQQAVRMCYYGLETIYGQVHCTLGWFGGEQHYIALKQEETPINGACEAAEYGESQVYGVDACVGGSSRLSAGWLCRLRDVSLIFLYTFLLTFLT